MDVKPKISRVEVVVNIASGSVSAEAPDEMRALLSELGLKANVCAPEGGELTRCLRDAVDAEWRRTDPEALARVAQFKERVSQFEEQAAKAQAAGKTKDAEKALAQAKQWREWAEAAESAVNE